MRFMMLMIPLGYETAPPDVQLDPERVKAMMKYNEALQEAGVLIALDGLHPPSTGARVSFATGKPVVTDGPFTEAKEVLGGYWMINVKSREEAIAWAKKCPASGTRSSKSARCRKWPISPRKCSKRPRVLTNCRRAMRTRHGDGNHNRTASEENLMSANDTFLAVFSAARPVRKWRPGMRCPRPSGASGSSGNRRLEGLGRKAPGGARRHRRAAGQDQEGRSRTALPISPTRWAPSRWCAPGRTRLPRNCSRITRTLRSFPASAWRSCRSSHPGWLDRPRLELASTSAVNLGECTVSK